MAATKTSCDAVTLFFTLGLEVVLWDLSEARSGEGKQPLKQGCDDAVASARDGCILVLWTWSSPPKFQNIDLKSFVVNA